MVQKVTMENGVLQLHLCSDNGEFRILHKPVHQSWLGPEGRLCSLILVSPEGQRVTSAVDHFDAVAVDEAEIRLIHSAPAQPAADGGLQVEFRLGLAQNGPVLELTYRVLNESHPWSVDSVCMLDDALPVFGQSDYAVLPIQQGMVVPVGTSFAYEAEKRAPLPVAKTSRAVGTYSGCGSWNMAMFALVQGDSTAVITWVDPSVEASLRGGTDSDQRSWIRSTVALTRGADSLSLHFLEQAGYVEVADYYRGLAQGRGVFVHLHDKIRQRPELAKSIGALRFTVAPKWGRSKGEGGPTSSPKASREWITRSLRLLRWPSTSSMTWASIEAWSM